MRGCCCEAAPEPTSSGDSGDATDTAPDLVFCGDAAESEPNAALDMTTRSPSSSLFIGILAAATALGAFASRAADAAREAIADGVV